MWIAKSLIGTALVVAVAVGSGHCLIGYQCPEQEQNPQPPQVTVPVPEPKNKASTTEVSIPVRIKNVDFENFIQQLEFAHLAAANLSSISACANNIEFEVHDHYNGLPKRINPPPLIESQAVRVKDVEFRAVVEPKCAGQIYLGLSITNHGNELLAFDLTNMLAPALKSSTGKEIEGGYEREEEGSEPPVFVPPGKTVTRLFTAYLRQSEGERTLTFGYGESGGDWSFEGLVPGKYNLRFFYKNGEGPGWSESVMYQGKKMSCWIGEVATNEVAFEIAAALKSGDE